MDSNSEIQGYNVYPMLYFRRKFSSGVTMLRPSPACPSLDVLPASVHSVPRSPETHSACTIWRDTYEREHHLEDAPCTSAGMLSMQRAQPSRKGLSPPSRRLEVNRRATERIDQRFDGLERCGSRRGSWLLPRGGFCLAQPAKSMLRSLLVNRFAVLDVKEVNTEICEPIDAPPLLWSGQPCLGGPNGKKNSPDDSPPTPSTPAEHLLSCL